MASNTMIYMNKMRNTLPLILEHLEFEVFQEHGESGQNRS